MIKFKRKLISFSNYSLCLTVPKKMTDILGWSKGDQINLYFEEESKTIKIIKPKTTSVKEISQKIDKPLAKPILPKIEEKTEIKKAQESEPVVLFEKKPEIKKSSELLRW